MISSGWFPRRELPNQISGESQAKKFLSKVLRADRKISGLLPAAYPIVQGNY